MPLRRPLYLFCLLLLGFGPCTSAAAPEPRQAAAAFAEARAACGEDAGRLWGRSLCVPLLFADPATRTVVADRAGRSDALQPGDGVFVGQLPVEYNLANTSLDWDGVRWAMVLWPLPEDPAARRALVMHESWHVIQDSLGLPMRSPNPAHLAGVDGRAALRVEWRALAAALRARDRRSERLAIADALAARAWRRRLDAQAGDFENALELNEGLATYTGHQLSGREDLDAWLADDLARRETDASFVRSFAYGSGPAYGRLLDRHAAGWRRGLDANADLGRLLAAALALPVDDRAAELPAATAARRGLADVLAQERALAKAQEESAATWRARLVDGPTLQLRFQQMNISFDPDRVFALPPNGSVYPALRIVDAWGVLEVNDGALIGDDWAGVTLPGPAEGAARQWRGPGWTLALADGWTLDVGGPAPVLRQR